ncbi:MAG: hypothetical protein ACO3GK_03855 [Bacteroidia bacterium]
MEKSQPLKTLKNESLLQLLGIPLPALVLAMWFFSFGLWSSVDPAWIRLWTQGLFGSVLAIYALDFWRDAQRRDMRGATLPFSWYWLAGTYIGIGGILVALSAWHMGQEQWLASLGSLVLVLAVLAAYTILRYREHRWAHAGSPFLILLGIGLVMALPAWVTPLFSWERWLAFMLLVWLNLSAFAYLEQDKDARMQDPNPWLAHPGQWKYVVIGIAAALTLVWGLWADRSEPWITLGWTLALFGLSFFWPSLFKPGRWYRIGLDLALILPLWL